MHKGNLYVWLSYKLGIQVYRPGTFFSEAARAFYRHTVEIPYWLKEAEKVHICFRKKKPTRFTIVLCSVEMMMDVVTSETCLQN